MATSRQSTAAKRNPDDRRRRKPGSGSGDYYRVEVRPKSEFVTFRTHDIGEPGHVQRIAGKRRSGSWDDQTWLISKSDAHVEGGRLVADTPDVAAVLDKIGPAQHAYADRFEGQPLYNGPEKA
jgi:hypothetical protein